MSGAILDTGTPTLHARAEAWECDFNGHWNTRFYCKSFQTAAKVAAMLGGQSNVGAVEGEEKVLRFHAEMHSGDPITVRSFDLADATGGPVTAHYMLRYGKLVATAVDYSRARNDHLTSMQAAEAGQALPRGLSTPITEAWEPDPANDQLCELGPVTAEELDADGKMQFWTSVARMSHASHHHDLGLGFTLELMKEEGVGRMLAEMRFKRLGACEAGDFLRVASRLTSAKGKAFTAAHMLYTHRGTPVAMFELCTLAVDMNARKAMDLPNFVFDRLSG